MRSLLTVPCRQPRCVNASWRAQHNQAGPGATTTPAGTCPPHIAASKDASLASGARQRCHQGQPHCCASALPRSSLARQHQIRLTHCIPAQQPIPCTRRLASADQTFPPSSCSLIQHLLDAETLNLTQRHHGPAQPASACLGGPAWQGLQTSTAHTQHCSPTEHPLQLTQCLHAPEGPSQRCAPPICFSHYRRPALHTQPTPLAHPAPAGPSGSQPR